MEEVFVMTTQLDNKTDWVIELEYVYYKRLCPRILPPGKSRSVQLSRIIKRCRKHGANWAIRVLINNEFTGIYITPENLLYHTRLVFEYKSRGVNNAALFDLCLVGIPEKAIDYLLRVEGIGGLFRRNNIWKKRVCARIAVADPKFAIDLRYKELEDLYLVAPLLRDAYSTFEHRTTEAINQHVAPPPPLAINDTNIPQGQSVSSGGDRDRDRINIPFVPLIISEEEERRRDVISTEHSNGTVGRVMKAIRRRCTSSSPYNPPGSTTAALRVPVKKDRGLRFGMQKARVKQILLQKRLILYRSRMHKFHHNMMKINMHLLFFVLALGLVIGFTRLRVVHHFISLIWGN